jgi:tetratricopeptide (TPR) repeat protein
LSDGETFDVFLSHNSVDKPVVREIAEALRNRGLRVWLDEWELIPGRPWQEAIEEIIASVRSALVFVGPNGFGPWEVPEMRACLTQLVRRKLPVVPVLLPACPNPPTIPLFLGEVTWVDLRDGITEDGLDRLEWGITGRKPNPSREKKSQGSTAPRLRNLPFPPLGDLLKGRDDELQRLVENLKSTAQATAITQAIHGLGGIGKTRLAVEYAWQSGDRYDAAFFVVADSPEALQSNLASLARPSLLNLPEYRAGTEVETVEAVLIWLRENSRWLLILDNIDTVEAAKAVKDLLPQFGNGHVLFTSRRTRWPATVREQSLGTLSRDEATQFLLQRTEGKRTFTEDEPDQVHRLAELLGGLPLALEQTAAYIIHHQMSFVSYLKNWERERERVLEWYDETVMDYPASVAATWQTTFSQLSPKAAAVLRLTAFLAPEPVPEEMFEKGENIVDEAAETLPEETGQVTTERSIQDGLAELAAYSMGTRLEGRLTVHRIVQEVLRARIPEDRRQRWIELSLRLVNDYSPPEPWDVRTWPVWDLLRPHALEVIRYADDARIARPTSRLMSHLGLYFYAKGLYSAAESLLQESLTIEERLNSDQDKISSTLNNLAQLLKATNRLTEAEPMMRRALQIDEASLGPQHPNVAIRLNNLALLLKATNRLTEAEPLMRRALQIDEASLGPQHPNVAIRLNNLALLLQDTNRLTEAEPMMRRALQIDEASLGPQHPGVAIDLNNLAQLLKATNRLTEAEPLMRRAVAIFEASLGADHPSTRTVRTNVRILLEEMGRGEPKT